MMANVIVTVREAPTRRHTLRTIHVQTFAEGVEHKIAIATFSVLFGAASVDAPQVRRIFTSEFTLVLCSKQ